MSKKTQMMVVSREHDIGHVYYNINEMVSGIVWAIKTFSDTF